MPTIAEFANALIDTLPVPLREAVIEAEMPSLGDGPRNSTLIQWCKEAENSLVPGHSLASPGHMDALDLSSRAQKPFLSGMWLLAGDIDRSHTISQDIGSAEGSFLHGIMHRREGDFGNAKYWFRRVGTHTVFDQIETESDGLYSDPFDFVDDCSNRSGDASQLILTQWIEWQSLMTYLLGI